MQKSTKTRILFFAVAAIVSNLTFIGVSSADPAPDVTGVIGLQPISANSCAAIWVPIPEDKALSGILWYNNDGTIVFPEVLLESGNPGCPVDLQDCQVMAEDVQGVSSGWSEIAFSTPVACLSEGLYVLFRFPEGGEYTADGAGGGAGLGYSTNGSGHNGWISADGEDWVAFKGDFGFTIQPMFVDASEATLIMQRGADGDRQIPGLVTALYPPAPNPFNPSTRLRFALAKDSVVEITIYDIRGALVRRLVHEPFTVGEHIVYWTGDDDSGRSMASGLYFARMSAGSVVMTQRKVLVQ